MSVGIDNRTTDGATAKAGAGAATAGARDSRAKSRDGRDRLLDGAGRLLAERGYAAMELRDVAERGKAPRGSIYHHFPRGKAQLAAEAAALDGERTREAIEKSLAKHGVKGTLRLFADFFRRQSARHPELIGCPVAAAALAHPEDPELAAVATAAFVSWETPIATALEGEGIAPQDAVAFAALTVSTIEGALLRTRAAGDHDALALAVTGLETAFDGLLAKACVS
jgi:TetR/AcrR family transcriptional regulator, lmrAB and yxaGH operons repressor